MSYALPGDSTRALAWMTSSTPDLLTNQPNTNEPNTNEPNTKHQPINQSHPTNHPMANQPSNQPANQPSNQPSNQPAKQPTNHPRPGPSFLVEDTCHHPGRVDPPCHWPSPRAVGYAFLRYCALLYYFVGSIYRNQEPRARGDGNALPHCTCIRFSEVVQLCLCGTPHGAHSRWIQEPLS